VNKSYIGSELNGIAKIAIYKDFQYAIALATSGRGTYMIPPRKLPTRAGAS